MQLLAAEILVFGAAGAAGLAVMQEAIDHGITSVGEVLRQVNLAAMGDSRQIVAYIALLYEALPDEVKEGMKLSGYTIPDSGSTTLPGQEIKEDKEPTKFVHNIPEETEPLSGYPDQSGERGKEDYIITADNASNTEPHLTIRDHYAHHKAITEQLKEQLKEQGYRVSDKEVTFGDSSGTGRSRPDIIYETPDGKMGIIEVKTGNADLTIRQSEIYPQIKDGNAIPWGNVADRLGLDPGVPLKDQGYPNGIPITIKTFPGAK